MMQFSVLTPIGFLVETEINKLIIEAKDGFHTLLPKHIDYVTALKTGIVSYTDKNGQTAYVACNEGILTKKGKFVQLATRLGIVGNDLNELKTLIETDFKKMEEARKETTKTMAQLEISLAQGLLQLTKGVKDGSF